MALIREENRIAREESIKEQREKVLAEGKTENQKEVVLKMKQENFDIKIIHNITGLNEEEINNIIKEA